MLHTVETAGASPAASMVAAEAVPDDLRNIEETARFFDTSQPTVRRWIAEDCPVHEHGRNGVGYKLSLRAVAAWRQGRVSADAEAEEQKLRANSQLRLELLGDDRASGEDGGKLTPRQELEALQAEIAWNKVKRERAELVRAESIELDTDRAFALIREKIRAMPDALAAKLGWRDEETSLCLEALDDLLEELATAGETYFAEAINNARA